MTFLQWVRDHIHDLAGLTAYQIAQRFLEEYPDHSCATATTPVVSLGNTLSQSVQRRKESMITREKDEDNVFRYYPKKG